MATETNVNIKIQIPAGHTARIENNTVIFEPKTAKFKKGDFVETENSFIIIKSATIFEVYVEFFLDSEHLYFDGYTESKILRLMTDLEKQILLDKLHEAGKDWDDEKCEIVDWTWRPKIGEVYWALNNVSRTGMGEYVYTDTDVEKAWVMNGFAFRTQKLAESTLELLKSAKHY